MGANKRKTQKNHHDHSNPPSPSKQARANPQVKRDEPADSSEGEGSGEEAASSTPVQVNNASLSELKNALDDTTKSYLNTEAGFKQNHLYEDFRLGLGWLGSFFAAGISFAGWYFGWLKTQPYTGYFVALYITISLILVSFSTWVEKDIVYMGSRPSGKAQSGSVDHLAVSTNVQNYQPVYRLKLTYSRVQASKKLPKKVEISLKPHFKQFFDVDGVLDQAGWSKFLNRALNDAISKL